MSDSNSDLEKYDTSAVSQSINHNNDDLEKYDTSAVSQSINHNNDDLEKYDTSSVNKSINHSNSDLEKYETSTVSQSINHNNDDLEKYDTSSVNKSINHSNSDLEKHETSTVSQSINHNNDDLEKYDTSSVNKSIAHSNSDLEKYETSTISQSINHNNSDLEKHDTSAVNKSITHSNSDLEKYETSTVSQSKYHNNSDLEKYDTSSVNKSIGEKKPIIGLRWVLIIHGFFSYFILFFVRNSFPVAVVAMVNSSESDSDSNYMIDTCSSRGLNSSDDSSDLEESGGEFNWSTSDQGIMLGAFFWGFVFSKLLASRLGEIFGQRATVATGTIVAGFLQFLSPVVAPIHPLALAAARFLTGVAFGPVPSALQSLISVWAPRSELSSMVTTTFSGATFGGMVGMIITGWLTDEFGWKITFWLGGVLCFLFIPFWIIFIRNSPQKHPWLTPYERTLLEANKNIKTKKTVPWFKILTCPYVWICVYSQFARTWLDGSLTTEGPTFFHFKIGLDISAASYVCGASYLNSMIFIVVCGRLSDMIVNRKYVRKITARKIFHLFGTGGSVIILIGICFADCQTITVIVLWILIGGVASSTACTYNVSVIDLAPNYTATVMGLLAIGNLGGALLPIVTSAFLKQENGWNKSFYLASGLSLASCVVYIAFMTAEAQPWNFEDEEEPTSIKEIHSTDL